MVSAEVPVDPDQVRGACRVHDAMIEFGQVTRHHRDPVATRSERAAGSL